MATDDLNAPLGQHQDSRRRGKLFAALPYLAAGLLGLFLTIFALVVLLSDDPLGGEPMVVATLDKNLAAMKEPEAKSGTKTAPPAVEKPPAGGETREPAKTVTIIDGTSGRRQEVTVKNPAARGSPDPRLAEQTRHGPIPKVAQDGARPADIYAKVVTAIQAKGEEPRIAIVLSGLGTGATRTVEGLRKLPPAVTLAFAPYAKDLDQWVARANNGGHELLLQVGMEPFDYPDNDPGPQTLLTSLAAEQNVDRLHWFMSRFPGYVGVTSYMGSRFTASEQAFAPVLREVAKRGLIYFDDGVSPRSLAAQIAGSNNAAFAKADVVLDASPTAADIDAALGRLEQLARERGRAIGAATALPVSIDRITLWAQQLDQRGIQLVPLTAVASRPKPS